MTEAACERRVLLPLTALCLALAGCAAPRLARTEPPAAPVQECVHPAAPAISAGPGQATEPGQAAPAAEAARESPALDRDVWAEMDVRLRQDVRLSLDDHARYYSPGNLAWVALGIG